MRPLMPHRARRRVSGRRVGVASMVAAATAAVAMVLTACSSGPPVVVTVTTTPSQTGVAAPSLTSTPSDTSTSSSSPTTTSEAVDLRASATPAFGSTDVGPNEPISVMAFHGTFQSLTMRSADGTEISGEMSADNRTWNKSEPLKYGQTYTTSGQLAAPNGTTKPFDGTLTTVDPKETMAAYVQIPNGHMVGIAAPIVVTFAGTVTNRANAEKQLHVTTTDKDGNPIEVVGSWGWMQDEDIQGNGVKQSRVHFRPKEYWPAHTQVHLEADLYGVDYGNGAWGRENIVRDFEIGPKIVVKTDIENYRLYVIKNDKILRNYPVSYGKTEIPGRTTVSGIHIVQNKNTENPDGSFTMCNPKYGYCGVTEYWGVRINNNGEFIHVNKKTEAAGLLGKANVSHGCVNMSMADGKEFYDMVYYGIPVEVSGTSVKMSAKDYVYDWALTWDEWQRLSAL